MSCGVGRRHGSDPELLWLWRGLAATAPIRPLAWEFPYAVGVALKTKNKKKEGGEKILHPYSFLHNSPNEEDRARALKGRFSQRCGDQTRVPTQDCPRVSAGTLRPSTSLVPEETETADHPDAHSSSEHRKALPFALPMARTISR